MSWHWRYEDSAGSATAPPGVAAPEEFATRSDAETWLGECWRELLEAGVAQVSLLDGERQVYGPMRLDEG
jgi:hypothetical protein